MFDEVQLLGVDRRRDVAAIRIAARGLPALTAGSAAAARVGDWVFVVAHPAGLPWSASVGNISGYRLADDVAGAGSGYRLLQFTAPAGAGASGGVLVDTQGRGLGLIVGSVTGEQNLNFAVPLEAVLGLGDAPVARTFGSGAGLGLPNERAARPQPRPGPPITPAAGTPGQAGPAGGDLANSEQVKEKDPTQILRTFRTLYIDATSAGWFGSAQVTSALGAIPEFTKMGIMIVEDRGRADVVLTIEYTFAWDYPFELQHQRSSVMLGTGKGSGPFSGPAGAKSVAKELVKLLKPYRSAAPR